MTKIQIIQTGRLPEKTAASLAERFDVHVLDGKPIASLGEKAGEIRAYACGGHAKVDAEVIDALPNLEIVANFGVGYDAIDVKAAAARNIIVTNTPEVLTEEVADTALGLVLMTVRELSKAERFVRNGDWEKGGYPLTPLSLRNRKAGIAGLGRIGLAIARRLEAFQVPVVYHTRTPREGVPYRHYADLKEMAADVNLLVSVLPGTAATQNAINADVLKALGPDGVLINIGRGSVVDEPALIAALKDGTIHAAGLDVFADEPHVPAELKTMDNVVVLPHVGSGSVHTRNAMGQLLIDNIASWFEKGAPITPVPETPFPRK